MPAKRLVRHPDFLIAFGLFLVTLFVHVPTLPPSVLDSDSGEWQYVINILGVPHSTGYPLFVLLGKLFTLLPFGNPAYRVTLFSVVLAALAVSALYLTAHEFIQQRAPAALIALLVAVAPMFWETDIQARVYGLNALLGILAIFFAIRFAKYGLARDLYLMSFIFGLALTNHRSAFFILVGLAVAIWFRRADLSPRRIMTALTLFVIPLLLYLYIPIRASQLLAQQDPANWALYPREQAILAGTVSARYSPSLNGFLNLVLAFDKVDSIGVRSSPIDRLTGSVSLLVSQFTWIGVLLGLLGAILSLRKNSRVGMILLLSTAGVAAIAFSFNSVTARFYYTIAYFGFAIWIGLAIYEIATFLSARLRQAYALSYTALALLIAFQLAVDLPRFNSSQDWTYYNYSQQLLNTNIAQNAVVIAPWEIATPLRYFQFVEGRRPDLLVIHDSPVTPQFQKILTSARSLKRPFYYLQFTPEDMTAKGPRTVQAVGLPLLERPHPMTQMDVQLTDSTRVIGYDVEQSAVLPGNFLRIAVYYQVTAKTKIQYRAELDLTDIRGVPHGNWEHSPVTEYYPTYNWEAGDFYRDVWDIPLPADAPSGLYSSRLTWHPYDAGTDKTDYQTAYSVTLGPFRIGDFETSPLSNQQDNKFANGMELTGYALQGVDGSKMPATLNGNSPVLRPGQSMNIALSWQAAQHIEGAYTVFLHLVDTSGKVWAQVDRPPWNGMFPTDRWNVGERVVDEYKLTLPPNLPSGKYQIRVGVYLTPNSPVPRGPTNYISLGSQLEVAEQ